jgi:uncharacterized RmlC-like cupin family protein
MTDRFEDERGIIQDLLGEVDSVTEIFTRGGAIRGNHVHRQTEQWTYIVSGSMLTAQGTAGKAGHRMAVTGDLLYEPAGVPHAWKAMEDTVVLVFTKGLRSGENYESDTERLPEEERLL